MTWNIKSSYSATPALNSAVNGVNVAEGCNASGVNDAIRQIMADLAAPVFPTVTADVFQSAAGSFSLPQMVATTLTTLANLPIGTWLASCQLQVSDPANYGQLALVIQDNGVLSVTNLKSGNVTLSASGLALQATNSFPSGTVTAYWSLTRLV